MPFRCGKLYRSGKACRLPAPGRASQELKSRPGLRGPRMEKPNLSEGFFTASAGLRTRD